MAVLLVAVGATPVQAAAVVAVVVVVAVCHEAIPEVEAGRRNTPSYCPVALTTTQREASTVKPKTGTTSSMETFIIRTTLPSIAISSSSQRLATRTISLLGVLGLHRSRSLITMIRSSSMMPRRMPRRTKRTARWQLRGVVSVPLVQGVDFCRNNMDNTAIIRSRVVAMEG